MSTVPTDSLDPYLRAREINPSLIPSKPPRDWRAKQAPDNGDFAVFLHKLVKLAMAPVTVPLHWIHTALTSPLTISLVLKLILLGFLTLASAVFSVLAVGAWWYSWGTGAPVEVEGWLFYGSKVHRTPHVMIPLPLERFQEELRYDVQVEMELVRPERGQEEMGNFMLSLQLRSARDQDLIVIGASQPSLPPPPLTTSFLSLPSFPTQLLPPCVLPWPFRSFCPSNVLGYAQKPANKVRQRRARGFVSPAQGKHVVLLRKELMEGVIVKHARGGDAEIGSAFVSIGREDSFNEASEGGGKAQPKEVRTTGWVVVRFVPRPTGIRWLLSAHPLPPLLILPPLSLTLALSSSLVAFSIISYIFRGRPLPPPATAITSEGTSEELLLAEKRRATFETRDKEEKTEAERRRREWEEVESSALGGLQRMPADKKRGESTIGGSETTAPTAISSFVGMPERSKDESSTTGTETETETVTESGVGAGTESEWEGAR